MKKLLLLIPFLSLALTGCTPSFNPGDSKESNTHQSSDTKTDGEEKKEESEKEESEKQDEKEEEKTHVYQISKTTLDLKVDEQFRLYVTCDGEYFTDIVWRTSDLDVILVQQNGNVVALGKGTATAEAFISAELSLFCTVNVSENSTPIVPPTPPGPVEDEDSEIVKFFKKNADTVDEEGTTYTFISAKSKYDSASQQFYIWDMFFDYDTTNDICFIYSRMNGTSSSGINWYYYGYNIFYWGDYKNGIFGGGYAQETSKGSETYCSLEITIENSSIVFHVSKELLKGYEISYTVDKNEFSDPVTSEDVIAVFARIQECCSYAKDVFTKFNVNLSLY